MKQPLHRNVFQLVVVLLFFTVTASSFAQLSEETIPPALMPWKTWVLHGEETRLCPCLYNDAGAFKCSWPSRLNLDLNRQGGSFLQEWMMYAKSWVPLPGGIGQWPTSVMVDGKPAAVVARDKKPGVFLQTGNHLIQGTFTWREMPEMLNVPPESGLVALTLNGAPIAYPVYERDGRLWLQKRQTKDEQEDRLEVKIYRKLTDAIPMRVMNHLKIIASGRAREVSLPGILLPKAIPINIQCTLPMKLGTDGNLIIQIRPGQWEAALDSYLEGPVAQIGPVLGAFGQETWVFEAQNHLRMVDIKGVPAIDPQQTDVPAEWKNLPAFIIQPDAVISFHETRRGDPDPAPDQLHLKRTWWLDFDGRGFTIHDEITGTLSRQWYLAMNPPTQLGRVAIDGVDQLITEQGSDRKPGVELRKGRVTLAADSRIDEPTPFISAVGWDHDFQSVSGELNLPPGWQLFTVRGIDVMPGTWFERWTLLDLFLILIIALTFWKLYSVWWGILALVSLILTYHEVDSPCLMWVSVLAATSLFRVLPEGRTRRIINMWRLASLFGLIVLFIPFAVQQIRWGIYPQLEQEAVAFPEKFTDETKGEAETRHTVPAEKEYASRQKKGYELVPAKPTEQAPPRQAVFEVDPKAVIQTGPGLPAWHWCKISMNWNGPVERGQHVRFYLVSPDVNLLLNVLRVLLFGALILCVINVKGFSGALRKSVPLAALFLLLMISQGRAAANAADGCFPSAEMLEQLKERMLKPADCFPECADIARMDILALPEELDIILEVHAATASAVPLPGDSKVWSPEQVFVENKAAAAMRRSDDGILWLFVPPGTYRVTMKGKTPRVTTFQLQLPLKPHQGAAKAQGWDIQGIAPDGQVAASLQLTRTGGTDGDQRGSAKSIALTPLLSVERNLELGLNWQVYTTVRRISPIGVPVTVSIPLIQGESVTTADIRVAEGAALITLDAKETELRWQSSLVIGSEITLKAPEAMPLTETWILDASPIWHCSASGIPVIHHQDAEGYWRPQWRPWPGEQVTITVSRPVSVPGRNTTIDSALLQWTQGERISKGEIALTIRASQGGQHTVTLPEGITVQQVTINDKSLPIRETERNVTVPLQPGTQTVAITWNQSTASQFLVRGPRVYVGDQAVNAHVLFFMPLNRWILWVGGPQLGPAVLIWSYLVVIILFAFALGRIPWSPLSSGQWLLLVLGLTQVHPVVGIIVVGWLLALKYRGIQRMPANRVNFNLIQAGLVILTVVALICLYSAIEKGLLAIPNMQIAGNGSTNAQLTWTLDRITGVMPQPWVIFLPLFVYRGFMLLWALWLAQALLKWLRQGWQYFCAGGIWKKSKPSANMMG
jgi:hypothetical protein